MKGSLLTVLLVGATAVWGWTFTVVKGAVAAYSVMGFLAARFAIASVVLAPISLRRTDRRTLRTGAALGAVLAAGFALQTLGLRYTSATNSGLITGLCLIFAPILDRIVFGVRPGRVVLACLAASFTGMVVLTGQSPSEFRTGDVLTGLCAAAYGLHIVLLSRCARDHDAVALAWVQMIAAAVLFAVLWPLLDSPAWPGADVWWALAITGVLASAAAFYVQTLVQQRLSAARTAVVLTMEPVFAVFFGYLLAGDRLTGIQVIGGAMIVGSLMVAELSAALTRRRRTATALPL